MVGPGTAPKVTDNRPTPVPCSMRAAGQLRTRPKGGNDVPRPDAIRSPCLAVVVTRRGGAERSTAQPLTALGGRHGRLGDRGREKASAVRPIPHGREAAPLH